MIQTTAAIVLHQFSYTESSVIFKCFTRDFGLQSYLIRGIRKQKSKTGTSFLQPISIIELTSDHTKNNSIKTVKEVRLAYISKTINEHPVKQAIAIFLNEILYKSIREEQPDEDLFDFIVNAIKYLDMNAGMANFHLLFLIKLSRFFGFQPVNNYSLHESYFNLTEGHFISAKEAGPGLMDNKESETFSQMIEAGFNRNIPMNRNMRKNILHHLVRYFQIHIEGMGEIRSLEILESIFAD